MCGKELIQCHGCKEKHWCKHYEHLKKVNELENIIKNKEKIIVRQEQDLQKTCAVNGLLKQIISFSFTNPTWNYDKVVEELFKKRDESHLQEYISMAKEKIGSFNSLIYGYLPTSVAIDILNQAYSELVQKLLKEHKSDESLKKL